MVGRNVDDLLKCGDVLFSKKRTVDNMNQEIAENFYPERADFTTSRSDNQRFMDYLTTSVPIKARQELGNTFSSVFRPQDKMWGHIEVQDMRSIDREGAAWLEWASQLQYNAMYDRVTNFVRATKEGDHDFAAFGGAVIQASFNRAENALLYNAHHPRDVAYNEKMTGQINEVHRNYKPQALQLRGWFEGRLHRAVEKATGTDKYKEIPSRHVVVEADQYQSGDINKKYGDHVKYISYHIDCEHRHLMEESPLTNLGYIIPRWQRFGCSQYPVSPAVVAALGDARLIQAMMLTLLEASEMAARPPMLAVKEAIRGDISMFSGGMTYVDADYDERLGEVLRPMTQNNSSIPLGFEFMQQIDMQIKDAFFLDKIGLPPMSDRTTAFEIQQRVSEYMRKALPLFEPMETEYNAPICELTFEILRDNGAFGGPGNMPESLSDREIRFRFESPLNEARDQLKSQKFLETKAMVMEAAQLDPSAVPLFDTITALRDVLKSGIAPTNWVRGDEALKQIMQQQQQEQQMQQMMQGMGQGGEVAKSIGEGAKALQEGLG